MSAFVVEDRTINWAVYTLAMVARNGHLRRDIRSAVEASPGDLAQRMHTLNVLAVHQRYDKRPTTSVFAFRNEPCSRVEGYKALRCWRYQCSEGNVPETALFKLLDEALNDLAHHLVEQMPEFDKAPWG